MKERAKIGPGHAQDEIPLGSAVICARAWSTYEADFLHSDLSRLKDSLLREKFCWQFRTA